MGSSAKDLADRIKSAAEKMVGGKAVAGGRDKGGIDCFALVDHVLKSEGGKSASDFGEVTPNADYVWGEAVDLDAVQPGDVLQFRDHAVKIRTQTLGETKWEDTSEEGPARRPHHTAVVVEVREDGSVVVVEQNVKPTPNKVTRNVIARLAEGEETRRPSNMVRKIITVTGTVKAYRPVFKPKGATLFHPDKESTLAGKRMLAAHYSPNEGGPKRPQGPLGRG
jgi:hypothetical protein